MVTLIAILKVAAVVSFGAFLLLVIGAVIYAVWTD